MKKITVLLFLIRFSLSLASVSREIDWNVLNTKDQSNHGPLLLRMDSKMNFKCDSTLPKEFSGKISIYMVNWRGYNECNATEGKLFAKLNCGFGVNGNKRGLDFHRNEAQNYYFIGFAATKKEKTHSLIGGSCKSHNTKLIIHFCDPLITPKTETCSMKSCPLPLGVEDGRIRDKQLTASSEMDDKHSAKHGRLYLDSLRRLSESAWCAAPFYDSGAQFLQVDLFAVYTVSAVATQGAPRGHNWVSSYLLHYSLGGIEWIVVTGKERHIKEFKGNQDRSSVVRHWLEPHFDGRYIRFVPLSWVGQRCMRIEIYGCKNALSTEELQRNLKEAPRPCETTHCVNVPHSMCFMYSGVPQCKCLPSCNMGSGSVCGSDAELYANECEMKRAACKSRKMISIHKRGPCPQPVACGKFCPSPYSRCVNRFGMEEKCECIQNCPDMKEPVCGSDEATYENICLLRKTACEKGKEIMVVKTENCQVKDKGTCPAPWSGSAVGKTCEMTTVECHDNGDCPSFMKCCHNGCRKVCVKPGQDIKVPPYSRCRVDRIRGVVLCRCEESCTFEYSPVCGTDGVTYGSECNLKQVACQNNNNNLAIQQEGECESKVKLTYLAQVVWRKDNPVFKSSGFVFIKPDVVLPMTCPERNAFVMNKMDTIKGVYLVSRDDFDTCDLSRGKLILDCHAGSATKLQKLEVKAGKVFVLGQTHYLVGADLSHAAPGAINASTCQSYHMKLAVHVCDSPGDAVCDVCSLPLGLEDGRIKDSEMKASSHLDEGHAAKFARLHYTTVKENPRTTWCANKTLAPTEYLTVNLQYESLVSAVAIQDVADAPGLVDKFELHYSIHGKKWYKARDKNAPKVFAGISTRNSMIRHWLSPRLYARFVRFVPIEWTRHRCMRVEVYGCTTARKEAMEARRMSAENEEYENEVYYITERRWAINTGMCGHKLCPPYAKCQTVDQHLTCVCPKCSHDGKKVCGSDGHTYKDICQLQTRACETNKVISAVRMGPCEEESATNTSTGVCSNQKCPPYAECISFSNGTNRCVCPTCASCGTKICGSDGRTYRDLCELMTSACVNNKNIKIAAVGSCKANNIRAKPKAKVAVKRKGGKSHPLKTVFLCALAVFVLGVILALAMCAWQPDKRPTKTSLRPASESAVTAFKTMHQRFKTKDPDPEAKTRDEQDSE